MYRCVCGVSGCLVACGWGGMCRCVWECVRMCSYVFGFACMGGEVSLSEWMCNITQLQPAPMNRQILRNICSNV